MRAASSPLRVKITAAVICGLLGAVLVVGGVGGGRVGPATAGCLFLVVTAVIVILSLRSDHRQTLRRLKLRARTPINQASPGETIKIVGRVRLGGAHLVAPLSGRSCVYYGIRGREESPEGGETVPDVFRIERAEDFLIDDGTGVASIEVSRTSMAIGSRPLRESMSREAAFEQGEAERDGTVAQTQAPRMWVGAARITRVARAAAPRTALERIEAEIDVPVAADFLEESVIEEGATVAALGRVMSEVDPDPMSVGATLRDRPRRVRLVAISARAPVCVSDDPETLGST